MARFVVVLVALAVATAQANIIRQEHILENVKPEDVGAVKGIPYVVESNFPAALNNVALSATQNALDHASNLVQAAQQLVQQLSAYDRTQKFNVAIEPAAYQLTSHYFAHYVANNYNVFVYSVQCHQ